MTPNSENPMNRLLFAVLKQVNLRHVDWEKVATDPVLLEPISNGHAARMRFARFRQSVETPSGSNRSTKEKKDGKFRVTKATKARKSGSVKSEGFSRMKQEFSPQTTLADFSPASTTSPYLNDNHDDFISRFLTPGSDDMQQCLSINPTAVDGCSNPPHMYPSPIDSDPLVVPSALEAAFPTSEPNFDFARMGADDEAPNWSSDWNDHLTPLFP